MSEDAAVRVLVVDDERLIRDGIASLLGLQPGVTVIGTVADGRQAIEMALEARPDVVLLDIRMPVMDGLEAVAELARRAPEIRVIMLTTFDDDEYVAQSLRDGAVGYLLKDLPPAALADAIRLAHGGVTQLDTTVARRVAARLPPTSETPSRPTGGSPRESLRESPSGDALTARETDVLGLVAAGLTNREIAGRLYVSEGTVKNHISRILTRLGLRDRTQAAVYARDHGLLP